MKLRVGKRAQQQADKIEAWWARNRADAPSLFIDELEETFRYICKVSAAGVYGRRRVGRTCGASS